MFERLKKGFTNLFDSDTRQIKSLKTAIVGENECKALEIYTGVDELKQNKDGKYIIDASLISSQPSSSAKDKGLIKILNVNECFNMRGHEADTPLHLAVQHCFLQLTDLFLKQGGVVNSVNLKNQTCLHAACDAEAVSADDKAKRLDLLKLLVASTCDDKQMTEIPMKKSAPGSAEDSFSYSGGQDISVNHVDNDGNTAIHYAAMNGLTDCVLYLIEHGAMVSIVNNGQKTCCELADMYGDNSLASELELAIVFQENDASMEAFDREAQQASDALKPVYMLDSESRKVDSIESLLTMMVAEATRQIDFEESRERVEIMLKQCNWNIDAMVNAYRGDKVEILKKCHIANDKYDPDAPPPAPPAPTINKTKDGTDSMEGEKESALSEYLAFKMQGNDDNLKVSAYPAYDMVYEEREAGEYLVVKAAVEDMVEFVVEGQKKEVSEEIPSIEAEEAPIDNSPNASLRKQTPLFPPMPPSVEEEKGKPGLKEGGHVDNSLYQEDAVKCCAICMVDMPQEASLDQFADLRLRSESNMSMHSLSSRHSLQNVDPTECSITCGSGHSFCFNCWSQYARAQLDSNGTDSLRCPGFKCGEILDPEWANYILTDTSDLYEVANTPTAAPLVSSETVKNTDPSTLADPLDVTDIEDDKIQSQALALSEHDSMSPFHFNALGQEVQRVDLLATPTQSRRSSGDTRKRGGSLDSIDEHATTRQTVSLSNTPGLVGTFRRSRVRRFIDTNLSCHHCPCSTCDIILVCPWAQLDHLVQKPVDAKDQLPLQAICDAGHSVCLLCREEGHAPCTCDDWKKWTATIESEMEAAGVSTSGASMDKVADTLWLHANTKKCPKCSASIEKDEGCNHMTCGNCRHDFCWMCMKDWSLHSQASGGYFQCNRFKEELGDGKREGRFQAGSSQGESVRLARSGQKMARFIHHYTRFNAHQDSLQKEVEMKVNTFGRIHRNLLKISVNELRWLHAGTVFNTEHIGLASGEKERLSSGDFTDVRLSNPRTSSGKGDNAESASRIDQLVDQSNQSNIDDGARADKAISPPGGSGASSPKKSSGRRSFFSWLEEAAKDRWDGVKDTTSKWFSPSRDGKRSSLKPRKGRKDSSPRGASLQDGEDSKEENEEEEGARYRAHSNSLRFLRDAFDELAKCRQLLRSSYAYAFFKFEEVSFNRNNRLDFSYWRQQKHAMKQCFDDLQSELEFTVEMLSNIVARKRLRASMHEIRRMRASARGKRIEFEDMIQGMAITEANYRMEMLQLKHERQAAKRASAGRNKASRDDRTARNTVGRLLSGASSSGLSTGDQQRQRLLDVQRMQMLLDDDSGMIDINRLLELTERVGLTAANMGSDDGETDSTDDADVEVEAEAGESGYDEEERRRAARYVARHGRERSSSTAAQRASTNSAGGSTRRALRGSGRETASAESNSSGEEIDINTLLGDVDDDDHELHQAILLSLNLGNAPSGSEGQSGGGVGSSGTYGNASPVVAAVPVNNASSLSGMTQAHAVAMLSEEAAVAMEQELMAMMNITEEKARSTLQAASYDLASAVESLLEQT